MSDTATQKDNAPSEPAKRELGQVHVMPSAFMTSAQKRALAPKKKKPVFLMITLGIFALVVSLAIAILLLARSLRNAPVEQTPTGNENVNTSPEANVNTRSNANASSNANQNVNTNQAKENANASSNANTNDDTANANEPPEENSNISPTPPTNTREPVADPPDADNDGLSDAEEDVFTTQADKPDSDADGYLDGAEVRSGFSPIGAGKLEDSALVKRFESTLQGYAILYPSSWPARATNTQENEVLFTSETTEFVQIVAEENPSRLNIFDWYAIQFPGLAVEDLVSQTVGGLPAVESDDGMSVFVASGDRVFTISYNIGLRKDANFRATFDMMVASFTITKTPSELNANSNLNSNVNGD